MLSICIVVKNRSLVKLEDGSYLNIFQKTIDNLINAVKNINYNIEINIIDFNSTDYPLREWIYNKIDDTINLNIYNIDGDFSKGLGLNKAGDISNGEYLFFMDADMLVDKEVIIKGLEYLDNGKVFFPICYSYRDKTHTDGWWRYQGWGNVFVSKEKWNKLKVPVYYTWGKEDVEFSQKINDDIKIRHNIDGFYHQWHPIDKMSKTRGIQKEK